MSKKRSIKRVVYRDKSGRFSKLDGRKKLIRYVIYSTGKVEKSKLFLGSYFKKQKIEITEPALYDVDIFKRLRNRQVKQKRFDKRIEFTKQSNKDYHIFLSEKKLNQNVSLLSNNKNVIVGTIRIKVDDGTIIERGEIQLTGLEYPVFGEYSRRKGKTYTPKDIIARYIHQMLADGGLTPYQKGISDGSIQKTKNKIGKKRHTKRQYIQIDLRSISKKTRKSLQTIDKSGHITN